MVYNLYPLVDDNFNYPQVVRKAIAKSPEVSLAISEHQERALTLKAQRPLIGAHVLGTTSGLNVGVNNFDPAKILESEIKAKFDIVSTYRAIGDSSAINWRDNVVPELNSDNERRILYVFEMWRDNLTFISEFDNRTGIYPDLVATLQEIIDGGHMDRVYLAPFHEGNGSGNYPWEMFHSSRSNTPELYKQCFIRFVELAREMGVTCKIIQWYLVNNSNPTNREKVSDVYVGDEYVDIVGLSYYNRSKAEGYSDTWTPVGSGVRSFANRMSLATEKPIWICEAGCETSNEYGDKGTWYSDLARLVISGEIPRLEAAVMFMQNTKVLENADQKRRFGEVLQTRRRGTKWTESHNKSSRNMFPKAVEKTSTLEGWSFTGLELSLRNGPPRWNMSEQTVLRLNKAESDGLVESAYTASRHVEIVESDYLIGNPYVLTADMRSSSDLALVNFGIRQHGSTATFSGDKDIAIGRDWTPVVVQVGTAAIDTIFRLPMIQIGQNAQPMWLDVTNLKMEPGLVPSPISDTKRTLQAVVTGGVNLEVHIDRADTFHYLAVGNRTLLTPRGTPVDGQEFTLRYQQDVTGGRTLSLSGTPFGVSSVPRVISTAPNAVDILTFQYVAALNKWYIVRCVNMS